MTKSSLCTYVNYTNNRNRGRNGNRVRKVTVHYMCAQWTGKQCADYFASTTRNASSNYCIGLGGDIAMSVDEDNRAWTSASPWNDYQAITIECANNKDSSFTDATWRSLVKLCADVCNRYSITPSYDGTKNATFTEHRMFASTDCPGSWMHSHMSKLVEEVKTAMAGGSIGGAPSGGSVDGETISGLGNTRYTGPLMITEWQHQLGTDPDGKISNQSTYIRSNVLVNVESKCFDGNKTGKDGSSLVKALQRFLNGKMGAGLDVDGLFGHDTTKWLQKWLNKELGLGLDEDGYYGPATSSGVGTALEKGLFK